MTAVLLAALLVLSGCRTIGFPKPSKPKPLPPEVTLKLQSVLEEAQAYEQAPGMIMAVRIGDSEPWIGAIGCEDEACTRKMSPQATFRLGSITKNFVGMAILQQASEGKLRLDDTLEKWLPGVFPNIDGNAITIRQLMNHTSGIESYTDNPPWIITVYKNPLNVWNSPQELLGLAQQLRDQSIANHTVIPPGSTFWYSNTNGILLGMIAAKVDGYPVTDWQQVLQRRFFRQLGLRHTQIPEVGNASVGSDNRGYANFFNFLGEANCRMIDPSCTDKDVDITLQEMSNAWSAGAIISTVGDLLKWFDAEVKGDLISPEIRRQQQAFIDTIVPNLQVGLSMFKQTKYGFIGHRGEVFGFNATMQYLPGKDMTVVVLANRSALNGRHVGPVPERVFEVLFPEMLSERQRARIRARGMETQDPPHIRNPFEPRPRALLLPKRQQTRSQAPEERIESLGKETQDPPHLRNPFQKQP
ncbi:serine hydrolase domain-containing protein [Melittangium boletus]|uniref:serine hydrolase domain-containing protein n=1 Tax=Melittangium boletus TaxID=83453 RepID=UPI0012FE985B|nr:serine hydrolase domain-containing protein [Melittangium boletus]